LSGQRSEILTIGPSIVKFNPVLQEDIVNWRSQPLGSALEVLHLRGDVSQGFLVDNYSGQGAQHDVLYEDIGLDEVLSTVNDPGTLLEVVAELSW
jgi:hypothetical protein